MAKVEPEAVKFIILKRGDRWSNRSPGAEDVAHRPRNDNIERTEWRILSGIPLLTQIASRLFIYGDKRSLSLPFVMTRDGPMAQATPVDREEIGNSGIRLNRFRGIAIRLSR